MKTILLADDSITIQKVVELTFSDADYRVICVSSGGQALKKMSEIRPDIILLDVIMPEKNGYEVCEQLKRTPVTSGIPILLLTGTFEPFDKKRADAAGANGHITKPFESQALVAKVEELIAKTPSVSADLEGGRMDIISGGEVYRVDPARAGEGMRAASVAPAPQPDPAPSAPTGMSADFGSTAALPPPRREPLHDDLEGPSRTHPAMTPPDPAAGGSFGAGFRDVGFGTESEPGIIPDRFDEGPAGSSAAGAFAHRDLPTTPPSTGAPSGGTVNDSFAGSFESEFDMIDEEPTPPPDGMSSGAGFAETAGWEPPPEAPPAETWQGIDEPAVRGPEPNPTSQTVRATSPRVADRQDRGEPTPEPRVAPLTPEMIDLIAEKVVERLADRVVREVAWEVVPGVAQALVRKRIKELEESGS